ncbi:Fic family protein [Reichenbachiella carrageenanivorans]|uniref:Fic family protein n=1 Tax=Reichenbachiella carrageenanivorans TaxID=2979869 RepID=A0ABY6D0P4_9BACT|nr:Fic family protein [Reichenbachiella carrageenanivorans]UXX79494.1 Fic family protein [Reichenbachiella carrageenanivorans]
MKFENPPSHDTENSLFEDSQLIKDYFSKKFEAFFKSVDSRYLYWDEVKYRKDLPFDPIKSWALIKLNRRSNYKTLTFGRFDFKYFLTESIQKSLHEFDLKMVGGLYKSPITNFEKTEYLKNSLLEEAIASSQIEGAATTTKVAWDMLKSGRKPRNESEQMIFNNLRGIRFIDEEISNNLSIKFIIDLHKIMTAKTSAEDCAGAFRDGEIYVQDHVDGEIAHTPPDHSQVDDLMEELCQFANEDKSFVHPIVKAAIIHFMIGFIHPFKDGNGRTARALFYWFLIKHDYSLIKNISISRAILDSRIQYDKAFLKTENDDNDLTYFITYSIKSLRVAFESLIRYRDKKKEERDQANLIAYKLIEKGLHKRQADLIGYLYAKESNRVNISAYSNKHDVVRQTARKDLNDLVKLGVIQEEKDGRNIVFKVSSKEKVESYLDS